MQLKPARVLMVEDNADDVELTRICFKQAGVRLDLEVVSSGEAALDFLHQRNEHAAATRPDLVLLDIGLPMMSGREVLAHIKRDSNLRRIPVLMLSSSQAEEDIVDSYDHYCSGYIRKPVDVDDFIAAIRSIENFWFSVVVLPS